MARADYVKSSPMVETITRVLQHADKQTLEQLVPSLSDIIKKNYGIMTKVSCTLIFTGRENVALTQRSVTKYHVCIALVHFAYSRQI